jgi:CRP-like cAMP-binding protein
MTQPEPQVTAKASVLAPNISPLLSVLNYFHPLTIEMEAYLKKYVTSLSVRKRKLLLKEGSRCEHVYFVIKGAVRGFTREGQKDITTWIVVENELVTSILSLNSREPSVENIQVLENTDLLVMRCEDVERMYSELPEFNEVVRKLLQHYYADAERRAFIARLTKAENKYRHFLLHHEPLANRIPLKYIASYLGMTLETLSRVRKRFSSRVYPGI